MEFLINFSVQYFFITVHSKVILTHEFFINHRKTQIIYNAPLRGTTASLNKAYLALFNEEIFGGANRMYLLTEKKYRGEICRALP